MPTAALALLAPAAARAQQPPAWSLPTTLSPAGVSSFFPALARAENGDVAVVYTSVAGGGTFRARGNTRPAGSPYAPSQVLSATGATVNGLNVAIGSGGEALAVWERAGVIQAAVRTPGDLTFGPPLDLTPGDSANLDPDVAMGADGRAVVAWVHRTSATDVVVRTRLRSAAGIFGAQQDLSAAAPMVTGSGPLPQLAMNADGQAVAVWQQRVGADARVQAASRESFDFGPPQTLSAAGDDGKFPQVGIDGRGDAVVAWERSAGGGAATVQAARRQVERGGSEPFGAPVPLSLAGAMEVQVGVGAAGHAVVVWSRPNAAGDGIVEASAAAPRGAFGAVVDLSVEGGNARRPRVAVDGRGDAVVAWERAGAALSARSRIETATRIGDGPFGGPIDRTSVTQDAFEPAVAIDEIGRGTVAWRVGENPLFEVQAADVTFPVPPPPAPPPPPPPPRRLFAPKADFTYSPSDPDTFQTVRLRSTSSDPDGFIEFTNWEIDGKLFAVFEFTDNEEIEWTFTKPGAHTVTVIARDDDQQESRRTKTIHVASQCKATEVSVNAVKARAKCLLVSKEDKAKPIFYAKKGATVRMNGIDFRPKFKQEQIALQPYTGKIGILRRGGYWGREFVGSGAVKASVKAADDAPQSRIDLGEQHLAPIQILRPKIALPSAAAASAHGSGTPLPIYPQKVKAPKFPLPLQSIADVRVNSDGSATFVAHVKLPKPLHQISGQVALTTTNGEGLRFDELHVRAENVPVYAINVRKLVADWRRSPGTFDGEVSLDLPFGQPPPINVSGDVHFVGKKLHRLGLAVNFNNSVLVYPSIFLQRIAGEYQASDPLRIGGDVRLTVGPQLVAGFPPVLAVDGGFDWTLEADNSWVLGANANMSVLGYPLNDASAHLYSGGALDFAGNFSFSAPPYSYNAYVAGGFGNNAFYVEGDGEACAGFAYVGNICLGAHGIVSSIGLAACGKIRVNMFLTSFTLAVGLGYRWGDGIGAFVGCDMGPYRPNIGRAQATPAGPSGVVVPKDLRATAFKVIGTTGVPRVALVGPDGTRFETPADPRAAERGERFWVVGDPAQKTTSILVLAPAPGRWTIEPLAGSPPIARVLSADSLPPARVTARLSGRGRERRLTYAATPIPGQRIDFFEVAGKTRQPIARNLTAARGTLRFAPADAAAARRSIVALVNQDGLPRTAITVARFVAPSVLPGRPRALRLRRRGTTLQIAWRPAAGHRAHRYEVRVRLRSGRVLRLMPGRARATVSGVGWPDAGTVAVRALLRDGRMGRVARVTLRRASPPRVR